MYACLAVASRCSRPCRPISRAIKQASRDAESKAGRTRHYNAVLGRRVLVQLSCTSETGNGAFSGRPFCAGPLRARGALGAREEGGGPAGCRSGG